MFANLIDEEMVLYVNVKALNRPSQRNIRDQLPWLEPQRVRHDDGSPLYVAVVGLMTQYEFA